MLIGKLQAYPYSPGKLRQRLIPALLVNLHLAPGKNLLNALALAIRLDSGIHQREIVTVQ